MTLVFNRESTGPGTHALIVASGDVPLQPGGREVAPARAAAQISSWLIDRFRNPTAELASVELLASTPSADPFRFPPKATSSIAVEAPDEAGLLAALERWRDRVDSDARNIAFFYYVGCVFRRPETLLVLRDFADPGRSGNGRPISFASLLLAMRQCRADRQIYFVDGLPLHVGSAVQALEPERIQARRGRTLPGRKVPGWAVVEGETVLGPYPHTTPFAAALLELLDRPRPTEPRAWVSARDVVGGLSAQLKRPARMVGVETVHDFDLHYPAIVDSPDPPPDEANTDFVLDDAEVERDELGRSVLAIVLARRLHKIWRKTNDLPAPAREDDRAAFVVHLDAPWGGGKTTFANFLGGVLNPCPGGSGRAASFLRRRYPDEDLGGIFLDDPPTDEGAARALAALPDDARRPWIVVKFNAWQTEHCAPPWWVFHQAIRKGCFDAIWREGDGAWRPRAPGQAHWRAWLDRGRRWLRARVGGKLAWLCLMIGEYGWRLFNPKILSLLVTALISAGLFYALTRWNILGAAAGGGVGFNLDSAMGLLFAGLTGVTAIWGLGALFTESIIPGTGTLAERLSLGNGDPFARFREHFARTVEGVRRPVVVMVDDLDRCRPEFVVDLVRGIQTLLRSPRVVFVILGDRDWIERAFETHHQAMKEVDVGPEQSFGARFVEKAIQMSFILPALPDDSRLGYVRSVLLGDRAAVRKADAPAPLAAGAAGKVREIVHELSSAGPGADPFDSTRFMRVALDKLGIDVDDSEGLAAAEVQLEQLIGDTLAIRAASDEAVEREVTHELQRLALCFPANPRQIKRIVNAITIYYAVALQRPGVEPDETFRAQLALWVIVMTEWPKTWRLLTSFPDLADILTSARPAQAMRRKGVVLPGSIRATERIVDSIRADSDLIRLVGGGSGQAHAPLQTRYIRTLAELTPLHSRRRRLADGPDDASAPVARGKARSPATGAAKAKRAPRAARPKTPPNTG